MRRWKLPWRLYPVVLSVILVAIILAGELRDANLRVILTGLFAALLALIPTVLVSRQIARPLQDLKADARKLAAGDLTARVNPHETGEFQELARALNDMASQLDEKIRTITAQRNEQQAILSSLREGVIAIDNQERVLYVNEAACELLDIEITHPHGLYLAEVVRNSELQRFVSSLLSNRETSTGGQELTAREQTEISVVRAEAATLQVTGTALRDSQNRAIGLLVVLNDITRLRRLEVIRRDFVANVSHELKTPLASIKGFVETLAEGALCDAQTARSFLSRIAQNTDRLNAIIEDLLSLSRIEEENEQRTIPLALGGVCAIVESAIAACQTAAAAREIEIGLTAREDVQALVNETLLEQAIVNLLDNAIKYSENGRSVNVEVVPLGAEIAIQVRDQGCGIAAEHLPRLFERFYRVDRARSRKMGGTGLGLAIVKHIAQAHRGRVSVDSTPGHGSTFTLYLPAVSTPGGSPQNSQDGKRNA